MREERFAPAREQVAAWQQALGRARDEAQRIADPFVLRRFEVALRRVAAELRSVEDAADVDAALLEALERARSRLGEAREVLASAAAARGAVERTLKVLATIDKALGEARLPTADAAVLVPGKSVERPPMRASLGAPQRFDVERGALMPGRRQREAAEVDDVDPAQAWRLFPPVDAPELSSTASPSALAPLERARRQIERLSFGAFAELGALGWLRRSNDSDAWYEGVLRFEARLLAQLDAVMAIGRPVTLAVPSEDGWSRKRIEVDMPEMLLRWSEDAVPGDTSRAFCRALVLGCLRGADTARVAVASLDAPTGLDRLAAIEALALASSPDLDEALMEGCRAPRIAVAAFEVARRRKCTDVATAIAALAHSDVKVARTAARALGAAPDRELAVAALSHALDAGLAPEVELWACESALRLGDGAVMRRVREHAKHLPADDALLTRWLLLLSLSNDRGDALVLRERAGDHIDRLEAWGYAGRVELAEALLERIEAQPKGITPRAQLAIFERVTGIAAPEPFDVRALRAEWKGTTHDASMRYRRGRRLSLSVLLEELGTYGRLQRERRMLALEVALHSGGAIRIDPDDWAARQSARIAAALGELT